MKAINGVLENGYFVPFPVVTLPKKVHAVLVYNETFAEDERETRQSWLARLHEAVNRAADEEMPDFPRVSLTRKLVDFADGG